MNPEKTIQICGRDVTLRYCAATETGFEQLASTPEQKRSITVFKPIPVKNDEGKVISFEPGPATSQDYLMLATAAIIAAADYREQPQPISVKEILYDTTPDEIKQLVEAVVELSAKWYKVSPVVQPETEDKPNTDDSKNA
jgi:hypothetical protein